MDVEPCCNATIAPKRLETIGSNVAAHLAEASARKAVNGAQPIEARSANRLGIFPNSVPPVAFAAAVQNHDGTLCLSPTKNEPKALETALG